MPLPKPRANETTPEFISRCISFAVDEGMPQKQAVAACYDQARRAGRKVPPPPKEEVEVNKNWVEKMDGLGVKEVADLLKDEDGFEDLELLDGKYPVEKKAAPKDKPARRYPGVKKFCGPAGGAPAGTFPINTRKRAIAALAYRRNAPNPEGIKKCVCRAWPDLPACKEKKDDLTDELLQDNPTRFQTDNFGRSGQYVTEGVVAGEYPELGEVGKVPKRMSLDEQDDLDELLPIK